MSLFFDQLDKMLKTHKEQTLYMLGKFIIADTVEDEVVCDTIEWLGNYPWTDLQKPIQQLLQICIHHPNQKISRTASRVLTMVASRNTNWEKCLTVCQSNTLTRIANTPR